MMEAVSATGHKAKRPDSGRFRRFSGMNLDFPRETEPALSGRLRQRRGGLLIQISLHYKPDSRSKYKPEDK